MSGTNNNNNKVARSVMTELYYKYTVCIHIEHIHIYLLYAY